MPGPEGSGFMLCLSGSLDDLSRMAVAMQRPPTANPVPDDDLALENSRLRTRLQAIEKERDDALALVAKAADDSLADGNALAAASRQIDELRRENSSIERELEFTKARLVGERAEIECLTREVQRLEAEAARIAAPKAAPAPPPQQSTVADEPPASTPAGPDDGRSDTPDEDEPAESEPAPEPEPSQRLVPRDAPTNSPPPKRPRAAAKPPGSSTLPIHQGNIIAVSIPLLTVTGPKGSMRVQTPLMAKALSHLSDGRMYGIDMVRKVGVSANDDGVRLALSTVKSSLARIGVSYWIDKINVRLTLA